MIEATVSRQKYERELARRDAQIEQLEAQLRAVLKLRKKAGEISAGGLNK